MGGSSRVRQAFGVDARNELEVDLDDIRSLFSELGGKLESLGGSVICCSHFDMVHRLLASLDPWLLVSLSLLCQ
jgi:hypothetical protein